MRIRCPICKEHREIPDEAHYRPFCSARCKTIDLGNWLDESYRLSRPMTASDMSDDEFVLE